MPLSEASSSCSRSASLSGGIVAAFWPRQSSELPLPLHQSKMHPPAPKTFSTVRIRTRNQTRPLSPQTRTTPPPALIPLSLTVLMRPTSLWVRRSVLQLPPRSHPSSTIPSMILNPSKRRAPTGQMLSKLLWSNRPIPIPSFRTLRHCQTALNVVPTSTSSTSPSLSLTRVPAPRVAIRLKAIIGTHT